MVGGGEFLSLIQDTPPNNIFHKRKKKATRWNVFQIFHTFFDGCLVSAVEALGLGVVSFYHVFGTAE